MCFIAATTIKFTHPQRSSNLILFLSVCLLLLIAYWVHYITLAPALVRLPCTSVGLKSSCRSPLPASFQCSWLCMCVFSTPCHRVSLVEEPQQVVNTLDHWPSSWNLIPVYNVLFIKLHNVDSLRFCLFGYENKKVGQERTRYFTVEWLTYLKIVERIYKLPALPPLAPLYYALSSTPCLSVIALTALTYPL